MLVVDDVAVQRAAGALRSKNWASFSELEEVTGLTRTELIASKDAIEQILQLDDPDIFLTSRIDLKPEGFEVNF